MITALEVTVNSDPRRDPGDPCPKCGYELRLDLSRSRTEDELEEIYDYYSLVDVTVTEVEVPGVKCSREKCGWRGR